MHNIDRCIVPGSYAFLRKKYTKVNQNPKSKKKKTHHHNNKILYNKNCKTRVLSLRLIVMNLT